MAWIESFALSAKGGSAPLRTLRSGARFFPPFTACCILRRDSKSPGTVLGLSVWPSLPFPIFVPPLSISNIPTQLFFLFACAEHARKCLTQDSFTLLALSCEGSLDGNPSRTAPPPCSPPSFSSRTLEPVWT